MFTSSRVTEKGLFGKQVNYWCRSKLLGYNILLLSQIPCAIRKALIHKSVWTTDIDRRSLNLRYLYPCMGLKWGVFEFPPDQNNRNSSGAFHVLRSEREGKHIRETPHGTRRSWTHFVCVCFCLCGRQNPKYLQLELHGWQHHYTGWYRSSGISFLHMGCEQTNHRHL